MGGPPKVDFNLGSYKFDVNMICDLRNILKESSSRENVQENKLPDPKDFWKLNEMSLQSSCKIR